MSVTLQTIEVLTADRSASVAEAAGLRQRVARVTVSSELMREEKCVIEMLPGTNGDPGVQALTYGLVIDLLDDTDTSLGTQYRIRKVSRAYGAERGAVVEAYALWHDLDDVSVRVARTAQRKVDRVFSMIARTPSEIMAQVMAFAPSGFEAGTVTGLTAAQQAALITISFADTSILDAVTALCEAITDQTGDTCEWAVRRSGDTYYVDLTQQVSASGTVILQSEGGTVSNRLGLRREVHGEEYYSRLSLMLGDEATGFVTLGEVDWQVTGVASASNVSVLTLAGSGAVPWDDFGVSDPALYFGNLDVGFHRITDSDATAGTVTVNTGTITIDRGYYATDAAGTRVDYMPVPGVEATYGIVEKSRQISGTPFANLVREAGHADDMSTWASGLPVGAALVGTPTVDEVSIEGRTEYGTSTAEVICDAAGEGLRLGPYTVIGEYVSAWSAISLLEGEIKMELVDEAGTRWPTDEQASSRAKRLEALAVGTWDSFDGAVYLDILSTRPGTTFYLDAATVTASNGSYPWAEVMGAQDLWAEAGRLAAEEGGAVYAEYDGDMVDLSCVSNVAGYDRPTLGSTITVRDGWDGGQHEVSITSRVVAIEREIIPMDSEPRVRLADVREDLVALLLGTRRGRGRNLPTAPIVPRQAPRLAVERTAGYDTGGGVLGVLFTFYPLTAKGDALENYLIESSTDGGAWTTVATDAADLGADDSAAYSGATAGGYGAPAASTATATLAVAYPAATAAPVQMRFRVTDLGSGMTSTPSEHLVFNPEIDASRITGELVASQLVEAAQGYAKDFAFAASDYRTVTWTTGDLSFANGQSYTIVSGTTGAMTASTLYYIYWDPGVSETVLQVSTTYSDTVGDRKVLLSVAKASSNTSSRGYFSDPVGVLGLNGEQLAVDSISTNHLQANSVTTVKLSVTSLTALFAVISTLDIEDVLTLQTGGSIETVGGEMQLDSQGITLSAGVASPTLVSDPTVLRVGGVYMWGYTSSAGGLHTIGVIDTNLDATRDHLIINPRVELEKYLTLRGHLFSETVADPGAASAGHGHLYYDGDYWMMYRGGTGPLQVMGENDTIANASDSAALSGYVAGNSSSNIPISNGTLCTGLNADQLDGRHGSAFGALADNETVTGDWDFSGALKKSTYGVIADKGDALGSFTAAGKMAILRGDGSTVYLQYATS